MGDVAQRSVSRLSVQCGLQLQALCERASLPVEYTRSDS